MKKIENWWLSIDRLNFIFILSLGITGVILSFSVNIDNIYYINRHSIFFILGIFILIFLSITEEKNIRRISLLNFLILLILLIVVIFLDNEIKGAKRWIKIFGFTLQPSEIIKTFFIILTAWCIAQTINGKKNYIYILFVFFIILIFLVLLQPDLGMTLLIASTFFCQLFVAGLSIFLVTISISNGVLMSLM